MKNFNIYLRVSTQKQGNSGLGLEAQRKMCMDFIHQNNGTLLNEFVDVESGTHRTRKGLWQAIENCKMNDSGLVIAKLDRLARDVEFTFKVLNTGIDIHFTDMPMVNTMILGVFASVAQYERELISDRTKKALAVKKEQGVKLGAASGSYRASFEAKSFEQKNKESRKRGATKNKRHIESKEFQVFLKILRQVFPEATAGEPHQWMWSKINTKNGHKEKVFSLMRDYKELTGDNVLFRKWMLDDTEWTDSRKAQQKLSAYYISIRKSIECNKC